MEPQQPRKRKMSEAARRFQSLARPTPPKQPFPCPRCNSMNTKFCYYNNYSLSQPRHFCKDCRRYWTHGGTCRNIPVGGNHSKKICPKATNTSEAPTVDTSSVSATSAETSLQSNAYTVPPLSLSMPSQSAGGYILPSYSSLNDPLLSPAIWNPPSLDYQQDTFNNQMVNNSNLWDGGISFDSNLGFMKGFDAGMPIASPLNNDYGQQIQPQSIQQDMYVPNGMNVPDAANWSSDATSGGGSGGSLANPTKDLPYTNFPGYGYGSNNLW